MQSTRGTTSSEVQGVACNDALCFFNSRWPFRLGSGSATSFDKLAINIGAALRDGTSLVSVWVFFLKLICYEG